MIEKRYKNYLEAEKLAIYSNSAAAERWMGFQDNADIYPNLEWRTAGDSDVRADHAKLEGLILPINDPFWRNHTPPLGFGCRCELTQTDKPTNKTDNYKDTEAPKGFDFNPGIDQKLFSNSAGYYTSAGKEEAKQLTKEAKTYMWSVSRNEVRKALAGSNFKLMPEGILKGKTVKLSNNDIKIITDKNLDNQPMRDRLLYDIKNITKDAKQVGEPVKDLHVDKDHSKYIEWYYYKVKGFDFYLNFVKMKSGEIKLHAITDSLK